MLLFLWLTFNPGDVPRFDQDLIGGQWGPPGPQQGPQLYDNTKNTKNRTKLHTDPEIRLKVTAGNEGRFTNGKWRVSHQNRK